MLMIVVYIGTMKIAVVATVAASMAVTTQAFLPGKKGVPICGSSHTSGLEVLWYSIP